MVTRKKRATQKKAVPKKKAVKKKAAKTEAARKKTAKKKTAKKEQTGVRPRRARDRVEDRSFGDVLKTKSTDLIVPELANRLEAGRQLFFEQAVAAADAELQLLRRERDRLVETGEVESPSLARIEQLSSAVAADLESGRGVVREIKRAVQPEPDGVTVVGRVARPGRALPKGAEIVFVADGNVVEGLGTLEPGADGSVRGTFRADVVKRLAEKGTKVVAAVRVRGKIVATDTVPVRLAPNRLHQFDLEFGRPPEG